MIEILLFNFGDFCADLFFKHYGIRFIVLTLRLCNLDSILDEFDAMRDRIAYNTFYNSLCGIYRNYNTKAIKMRYIPHDISHFSVKYF